MLFPMQPAMSKDVIERLSRYRSVLLRLKALGFVRVFSDNLADALGVSGSLVRKDLGQHGIHGVRRGGYTIEVLIERLTDVLGVSGLLQIVVVGCGHIGSALLRTYGGRRHGISAVAGFDIDPQKLNAEAPVPVLDVHELAGFVAREAIDVAVLCVPEEAAATVMELIRGSRIRGVLNFTTAHLRSDAQCLVQTLDIRMEIEKLFCLVKMASRRDAAADPVRTELPDEDQ